MAPPRKKEMCYVIISARSLTWFLLTIFATMLAMVSLFTPYWLIAPNPSEIEAGNHTILRFPSFGLSSRCKKISSGDFECSTFPLTTANEIFPLCWKISYIFMAVGFFILGVTSVFSLLSFCRQSLFGKSLHSVTGSLQILSGIFVMVAIFTYPIGWDAERVAVVCHDISPFYPGECSLGYSFYSSILLIITSFICGFLSLKAEKASMNPSIQRRIEEGNERLVFAP
ncbi:CLUMA_CG013229, isoform A [Clunio marinus]|uniref:CLUMA_CG013229, isoform A n=1 Tax=Clunio marinus TaxID=568069 RepID=A0A1J1IN74_9DIPT|nr:CLUMA_CG013229, isoform A [Clunio marinus]